MIGRDPAAAVPIDDVSVSRYHARILIDGSAARIEDLGSKNGTYVRDKKLETGTTPCAMGTHPLRLGCHGLPPARGGNHDGVGDSQ